MSMSVNTGPGVRAEPNVVPMIDVMLVLLIIFMVVTPALQSGFQAEPPSGINLKAHPEAEDDQVLGIDKFGAYYINKVFLPTDSLASRLYSIYSVREIDKILYLKAHGELEYGKIIDAMEVAAKNGVRVVGAITNQQPGTESTVAGDEIKKPTKN